MADVEKFPVEVKIDYPPQEGLIERLKELLERAEAGQLQGIAMALVWRDNLHVDGIITCDWFVKANTHFAMTAAINRLERRWGHHCDDTAQQVIESWR